MAVKNVAISNPHKGLYLATWVAGADGDTGSPIVAAHFPDKTVQAVGDATSVAIQGSMDGTNWFALTDSAGDTIALVGASKTISLIRENPLYIRPFITGGSSTVVYLLGTSER